MLLYVLTYFLHEIKQVNATYLLFYHLRYLCLIDLMVDTTIINPDIITLLHISSLFSNACVSFYH